MKVLISGTKSRPEIVLENEPTRITISGWSFLENPVQDLQVLFDWIRECVSRKEKFSIVFDLDCYNTSSSKAFVMILLLASDVLNEVIWIYDSADDETMEWGQELEIISELQFVFKAR
jgi:hypothetical protein